MRRGWQQAAEAGQERDRIATPVRKVALVEIRNPRPVDTIVSQMSRIPWSSGPG